MATGPDGSAGRGGVPGTALTMRHERVRVPERRSAFVATLRDRVPPGIRVHPTVLLLRRMAGCLLWGAIGVVTDACRIVAGSCRLVFGPHHRVETGLCLAALRAETTRTDAGGPVCCTARVYNRLRDCSTAEFELVLHGATKAAGLQVTGRLPLDGRTHHDVEFIVSGGECRATMDGRPIAELKQDLRRRRRRCDGYLEATLTVHDPSRRDGPHRLQVLRRLEGPGP